MRARRPTSAVLSALLLFAVVVACDGDRPGTARFAYSSDDVALPKPELKTVITGGWLLSAEFAWRTCGERGCWTFDQGRHGGPDVFGVTLGRGPRITVQSASLRLRSSCGSETWRNDAVTGDEGAFFLVQDATGKNGSCDGRLASERAFSMASGRMEVLVMPVAGSPCGPLLSVDSLFGHSYADTGLHVKVNAGPSPDGKRIDWGEGDQTHQFQAIPATPGIYDCSGAPK